MAWKPASGGGGCVHKSSRTGEQCRLWGVSGTDPPTCATHGASAPQVRAAAARREAGRRALEAAGRLNVDLEPFDGDAPAALSAAVTDLQRRVVQVGHVFDASGGPVEWGMLLAGVETLRKVLGEHFRAQAAAEQARQGD